MTQPVKTPRDSAVESRYMVMPQHANPSGTAFGGVVMSWIDMVAAMVAQRHCDSEVVTASIDSVSFEHPVHVGDQVTLLASVNYVGVCSFEVGVKVLFYHPETGLDILATKAYLTFVSIDDQHHPVPAPRLEPQTPDEKRRWRNATLRVKARKALRKEMQEEA